MPTTRLLSKITEAQTPIILFVDMNQSKTLTPHTPTARATSVNARGRNDGQRVQRTPRDMGAGGISAKG